MPTTAGTISRRTPLTGVNNPNVQTSLTAGNDSLIVGSAAADGLVFVRDRSQTDGWGFRALTTADVGLGAVENTALSTWAGSANLVITNANLAGSIAYSKLSLTGAILNADLAGSIAYSKLALTGAILNADLAGSIAASKLVGTDIATVGTLTAGATGTGFTIALSASTVTGSLADARLSANVPLIASANVFSAAQTASLPNLITTSTDGIVLQNLTAATAGVPVQQSPRIRLRSNVWNTTAVAATNTNDWWIESVPVTGATPSGLLKIASSLNGAGATFPMTLTSGGVLTTLSTVAIGGDCQLSSGAALFYWNGKTITSCPLNGQLIITNWAATAGVGLDITTDALLKVRTRAQTGDASLSCLNLTASGTFGCNGSTAQSAVASGGALAAYVTGGFGLDSNAHMTSLFNLVVAMRSALVANGIMS